MSMCDNTSVGVILKRNEDILLLERAKFPYGLAPPAGHIDTHGSAQEAAVQEVFEEVGLQVAKDSLVTLIESRRINNQCRRKNGDHHVWTVYSAESTADQTITPSPDETRNVRWYSQKELQQVAHNTRSGDKETTQVFERIWLDMFDELGYI